MMDCLAFCNTASPGYKAYSFGQRFLQIREMSAVRDDKGRRWRTGVTSVALCALFADSPFSIRNSAVIADQSDLPILHRFVSGGGTAY